MGWVVICEGVDEYQKGNIHRCSGWKYHVTCVDVVKASISRREGIVGGCVGGRVSRRCGGYLLTL